MGREALVYAEVDGEAGEVRALLESSEFILRGAIKRRYVREALEHIVVDDDTLQFESNGEQVRLCLGAAMARKWAEAMQKAPPTLREKLGLNPTTKGFLVGVVADDDLASAVQDCLTESGADARMLIAVVENESALIEALRVHSSFPSLPIWTVYAKGRGVTFGDTAIRTILRDAGFRDTKSCAVSASFTATRYHPI